MGTEDALIIREWRKTMTWRMIAESASEKWPERGYNSGDQIVGRELCIEAAKTLKEDHSQFPWN